MKLQDIQLPLESVDIYKLIPHRPPFLLVDRVVDFKVGEWIKGHKCISSLEPFFPGHFPNYPVVPGVLIVEGLAQTGAILHFLTLMQSAAEVEMKCLLTGVQEAKFRRPVKPGDVLQYEVKLSKLRGNFVWFEGTARVDSDIACEVKFSAMVGGAPDRRKKETR